MPTRTLASPATGTLFWAGATSSSRDYSLAAAHGIPPPVSMPGWTPQARAGANHRRAQGADALTPLTRCVRDRGDPHTPP